MSRGTCATAAWAPMKKSGNTPGASASLSTIALKHLTGEKQRRPWYLGQIKSDIGEDLVSLLDAGVAD